ncbi:hypothetical protein [Buttiauxella gaviniae]|uniref:hypothetical protein n=1 Tax=Buttiauxella gaviniae TaxID=82990 RepID=UPI0039B0A92F
MNNIDNKISFISLLTFLAYVSFLSYKFGECIFYGYPIELIWTDTSNLISILVKNMVIIFGCLYLIYASFKRSSSLLENIFIIACGMLGILFFDFRRFATEWQGVLLIFIQFAIIFSISSCLKKSFSNDKKFRNVWNIYAVVLFCIGSALLGNLNPTLSKVFMDSSQNIVAGNFKDYAIKVSCDYTGKKKIHLSTYENIDANVLQNTILTRNWFWGVCKPTPQPIIFNNHFI